MLSDEEKILTKKLRYCEQEYEQDGYLSVGKFEAIEKAVNLIEKQSKEIEELKQEKEYLNCIIESDKDNYINKDKIKAKIEEVEQWELYNMKIPRLSTLDERLGAKIGIKYVLQSLLEKE